jgi:hypothetical protein
MGHVGTKRRGSSWSAYDQADINLKHSLLHPDYLVGTFPALFNVDTGGLSYSGNLGGVFLGREHRGRVASDAVRSKLPHEISLLQGATPTTDRLGTVG